MIVLGINGMDDIFHDSSASLIVDGKIVASVEEERFNRKKHSSGIPRLAMEYCIEKAGISFSDVDHIGYYLDPDLWIQARLEDMRARFKYIPNVVEQMARQTA